MAFEKVEKDRLTKELILKDILHAAKTYTPRRHYYSAGLCLAAGSILSLIAVALTRKPVWFLLLLPFVAAEIGIGVIRKKKAGRLTPGDLTVFTDTVNAVEEKVVEAGGKYGSYRTALVMYFEGSGEWEIPYDNYTWSKNWHMGRQGVENTSLHGDTFYIVRRNDTGEIAVAYNRKFFDYQD
ncbi:MAG: hypothetical protein MJ070_10565 [Lachnospiraceae bacterium]|nr:hypothetical protein [Lachnospiraceae bacterium]